MIQFFELFEKLSFEIKKYGSTYTAMLFKLKDKSKMKDFQIFLLKYLRLTDTVFSYREDTLLVILEETSVRGAISLNKLLKERIEFKSLKFELYCAAIQ